MLKVRYILSRGYNTNIIQFQLSTGFIFCLRNVLLRNQSGLSHSCVSGIPGSYFCLCKCQHDLGSIDNSRTSLCTGLYFVWVTLDNLCLALQICSSYVLRGRWPRRVSCQGDFPGLFAFSYSFELCRRSERGKNMSLGYFTRIPPTGSLLQGPFWWSWV